VVRRAVVVMLILAALTVDTQIWTFKELFGGDIVVGRFQELNVNTTFRSDLSGEFLFDVRIYANYTLTMRLTINNVTVEITANKEKTFEGVLGKMNTIRLSATPQLVAVRIYGNSTIKAKPKTQHTQNLSKEHLILLFWASIIIPPILIYIYRSRTPRRKEEGGEETIVVM